MIAIDLSLLSNNFQMEQDDVYDDKLDLSLLLPADFLSPQNTGEGFLGSTGSDDSLTLISNLDISPERRIETFQVPESSSSTKSHVTLGTSNRNDYQSREDIFTEESFFMDAMADLNVADVLNDQEPVFSLNYDLRMEKDNFEEDDADSQEEFYSAETTPVLKPVATPAGQLQQETMTIVDRFCLDSPNTSPTRLSPLKLITITPNAKPVDDSDLFMENPVSTPRASITDPDQRTSTVTSPTANNTSITSMISSPYSEQNNVMNSPLSDLGTPRRQELHEESKTPTAKPVKVETEKKPSLFRSMSRLRSPSKVKSVFRPVVTVCFNASRINLCLA